MKNIKIFTILSWFIMFRYELPPKLIILVILYTLNRQFEIVIFSASSWFCQCFCLLTPFIETPITQAIFISQTCSTCQKIPLSSYFVMLHRSVTWQFTKILLFQWRVLADSHCFYIATAVLKLTILWQYLVSWSVTKSKLLKSKNLLFIIILKYLI